MRFEEAKDLVDILLTFNENSNERKSYYRALSALLDIELEEELNLEDYLPNMTRMFGSEVMDNAVKTLSGEVRFLGLSKTSMRLQGLDKQLKLIESYQKLQRARS
ncbi:MAG: ribosomal protein S12 methylthiotransferase accessory factor [Bacteriovoracaceae bacterium]